MTARIIPFPFDRVCPTMSRGPAKVVWLQTADELYRRANDCDVTDPELGERLYRAALELDPTMALAWTNLGNLEHNKGDRRAARVCYTKALMLDAAQPEANYNMGYMFAFEDRHEAALPYYLEALKHDPRFADAWYNYGCSLVAMNRRKHAKAAFRRYLELESTGPWAELARRHV